MSNLQPFVEWDEQFRTGIHVIDEEHRFLIENINLLHQINEEKGLEPANLHDELEAVLRNLTHYTQTHFIVEEEMMRVWAYEGYHDHKLEHDKFVHKLQLLQASFEEAEMNLSPSLIIFLKDWLTNHILGTDLVMAAYLKDKGQN